MVIIILTSVFAWRVVSVFDVIASVRIGLTGLLLNRDLAANSTSSLCGQ